MILKAVFLWIYVFKILVWFPTLCLLLALFLGIASFSAPTRWFSEPPCFLIGLYHWSLVIGPRMATRLQMSQWELLGFQTWTRLAVSILLVGGGWVKESVAMGHHFSTLVEKLVCEKETWTKTRHLENHRRFQVLDPDVPFHGLLAILWADKVLPKFI